MGPDMFYTQLITRSKVKLNSYYLSNEIFNIVLYSLVKRARKLSKFGKFPEFSREKFDRTWALLNTGTERNVPE